MNQEKIGKFIAERRKEQKLTQEQLAEKLNISKNAVSKWERGLNLPDVSIMQELCKILVITLNELFVGEKISDEQYKEVAEDNLLNAIKIYTTKGKIEILQILTELLILSGIIITISLTEIIAKTTTEKIITFCIGAFIWTFGMILRIILKKIHNPFK